MCFIYSLNQLLVNCLHLNVISIHISNPVVNFGNLKGLACRLIQEGGEPSESRAFATNFRHFYLVVFKEYAELPLLCSVTQKLAWWFLALVRVIQFCWGFLSYQSFCFSYMYLNILVEMEKSSCAEPILADWYLVCQHSLFLCDFLKINLRLNLLRRCGNFGRWSLYGWIFFKVIDNWVE